MIDFDVAFTRGFMGGCNRPGWKWSFDCMEDYDVWLVIAGTGCFYGADKEIPLSRGDCLVIPPGMAGKARQDADAPLHTIAVHFKCNRDTPLKFPLYCRIDEVDFLYKLMEKAIKTAWTGDVTAANYWLLGVLEEVWNGCSVGKNMRSHQGEIEALCRKIAFAPERPWKVIDMARQSYLCREHFSKIFHQIKGMSPQDFIINQRVERAGYLLCCSNQTVAEIADACGYSSEFFFSRQFKLRTGMTPSAMRKRHLFKPE